MNKKEISVSILDCDFNKLKNEINNINNTNCDYIHIDVMDGSFVPSKAFDLKTIKKVNLYSKKKLDYHLMVNDPINYIEKCADNNAEIISIHYEGNANIYNDLVSIKQFYNDGHCIVESLWFLCIWAGLIVISQVLCFISSVENLLCSLDHKINTAIIKR